MSLVEGSLKKLSSLKNYPKQLFYSGELALLDKPTISIVGSRKPSQYSRFQTQNLASLLAKNGVVVVSGGAIGIDALAHLGAGAANTIAVLPCGINVRYPAINKNLLDSIGREGLLLSQFDSEFKATPWSFVLRNEIVVSLGEVLVVSEADIDSGTMRSVEYALKSSKEIFVFPQRLGESLGTNELLKKGLAKPIYDLDEFVSRFGTKNSLAEIKDDFLLFCSTNPTYDEVLKRFPERIFEAELLGEIHVINGVVALS